MSTFQISDVLFSTVSLVIEILSNTFTPV